MAKPHLESVSAYIDAQPEASQEVLVAVRHAIRKAVPAAEESISYHMPTYKLIGSPMLYFASWKRHFSLYPISSEITAALARELEPYEVEKGTVRFPLTTPAPTALVTRIAKMRAAEIRALAKAKSAKSRA